MINIFNKKNVVYLILSLIILIYCIFTSFKSITTEKKIEKLNKIETLYLIQDNLEQSNFLTALSLIKISLKLHPNNPDLLFKLAMVYYSTGCYDEAEKTLKVLISKERSYTNAFIMLGQIYHQKHAYSEAIKIYEYLLTQSKELSQSDTIYNKIIELCINNNNNEKALYYINKALIKNKNNPIAIAYKGIIISKTDPQKALKLFALANKINNKVYQNQIGQATVLMNQKKYDEVLKVLNRTKILFSNNSKIYYLLAITYDKQSDSMNTLNNLIKSIQLNQNDMTTDDYNKIISLSEKLLKETDSQKELYEVIATAYIRLNNNKKAISTYLKAIKNNSDCAEIHNNLAGIYVQISITDALKEYLSAIKKEPKNYIYYYGLANAYNKGGNIEKAIEYTNKTLLLNPNFSLAEVHLGNLYKSLANYQEATLHYRKALKLNHSEAFAYVGLGNIFFDKKMYDQAIWNYENFLKFSNDYKENAIVLKKSEQIILLLDKN